MDALADLLKGRTKHIAVLSDDSDFASLFAAVKQEIGAMENPKTLFKWFMTNRTDTRSPLLTDFLPAEYIHTVVCALPDVMPKERSQKHSMPTNNQKSSLTESSFSEAQEIAKAIVQNTTVGSFKSSDCKKIIIQNFPKHPLAKADSAAFGTQFAKDLWPSLEKFGVKSVKTNRGPRKYEMTEEAKKAVVEKIKERLSRP